MTQREQTKQGPERSAAAAPRTSCAGRYFLVFFWKFRRAAEMCRGIGAARGAVFSCLFLGIPARGGEAQWIGAARGAVFSCLFAEISARRGGASLYCIVGDAGEVAESAAGGEWGRALCIAGEARPFQENILIFCRQTVDKRRRKGYTIIEHLKKYSTIKRPVGRRSGVGRASVRRCAADFCGRMLE